MTVGLRKLALTAHVTSSVGWFGAVAAFLALAIVGLTSPDPPVVRAAYLAMHLVTWFVIVPDEPGCATNGPDSIARHDVGLVSALLDCHETAADVSRHDHSAHTYAADRQNRRRRNSEGVVEWRTVAATPSVGG